MKKPRILIYDNIKHRQGNDLFKVGNYDEAVKLYKQASKIYKPLPAYMLNLAAAYIKLERSVTVCLFIPLSI